MIQVDIRSRIPIYEQLYENVRVLILKKIMVEDQKLPSVRELASMLAINPNTIQKAYRALENDGYIYSVRGKGNFVKGIDEALRDQEVNLALSKIKKATVEARLLQIPAEQVVETVRSCYEEGVTHD